MPNLNEFSFFSLRGAFNYEDTRRIIFESLDEEEIKMLINGSQGNSRW